MAKFLIDANLPYHFKLWNSDEFIHVVDIDETLTDEAIWEYAKNNDLTIVSKDSDFSNKIIAVSPPPHVIHIRIGNLRIHELYEFFNKNWELIVNTSKYNKLTNVYISKIEGIK